MSHVFLAAPQSATPPGPTRTPREEPPRLVLESLDGSKQIVLGDQPTGWKALAGATGLDLPPMDVATAAVPGVAGSMLQDVRALERPIFIPIRVAASDRRFVTHRELMRQLLDLVDPLRGEFRIVGITPSGSRELTAVYTGGLEGSYGTDQFGLHWRKVGLTATACQPFASARTDRRVEFGISSAGGPFLGVADGTDAPWPRAITSSAVIGNNMRVQVVSEVPVYPTVELVGPMDSFAGTLRLEDTQAPPYFGGSVWSVSIPQGVPEGMALRLATDPRARSARLGSGDPEVTPGWAGERAAGRVARGSSLSPFYPGVNVMDVSAPGGTNKTRVRIRWRELYRSLW